MRFLPPPLPLPVTKAWLPKSRYRLSVLRKWSVTCRDDPRPKMKPRVRVSGAHRGQHEHGQQQGDEHDRIELARRGRRDRNYGRNQRADTDGDDHDTAEHPADDANDLLRLTAGPRGEGGAAVRVDIVGARRREDRQVVDRSVNSVRLTCCVQMRYPARSKTNTATDRLAAHWRGDASGASGRRADLLPVCARDWGRVNAACRVARGWGEAVPRPPC